MPAARLGAMVLIASETMFFVVMIASYVHLRYSIGTWPPPGLPSLRIGVPLLNTVILLGSGLTAHLALEQLRRGREGWFRALIILTAILGTTFLGIQAYEYGHVGFSLSSGVMGSTFFLLTGFHGAHVIAGVLVLLLMLAASWGAKVVPRRRGLAEGGVLVLALRRRRLDRHPGRRLPLVAGLRRLATTGFRRFTLNGPSTSSAAESIRIAAASA